ncbi:MAG: hypothetical protein QOG27_1298, partial [Verrucomicrobiota bacterium]
MLKEENSLPGSELQFAAGDRNDFAGSGQRHANVRGAVIRAFIIVL